MKGGKDGCGTTNTETKRVKMSCESIVSCLVLLLVGENGQHYASLCCKLGYQMLEGEIYIFSWLSYSYCWICWACDKKLGVLQYSFFHWLDIWSSKRFTCTVANIAPTQTTSPGSSSKPRHPVGSKGKYGGLGGSWYLTKTWIVWAI